MDITKKRRQKLIPDVNILPFIEVKTPEVAYLLGFIWADGHISFSGAQATVSVQIVEEDANNLRDIFLKTGKWNFYTYQNKKHPTWKPVTKIVTQNRPFAEYLVTKGYKSKSDSCDEILKTIPMELQHYFFRGLFDGDGCLHFVNRLSNRPQIVIASEYTQDWTYLEQLLKTLNIKYNLARIISKKNHKSSRIRITGIQKCKNFLTYIYQDEKFGLDRKYDKYKLISEYIGHTIIRDRHLTFI